MTKINIDGTTIKFANGTEAEFATLAPGNMMLALEYVAVKARQQQQLIAIAQYRNGFSKLTMNDMLFGCVEAPAAAPACMIEAAQNLESEVARLEAAITRRILPTATPAEAV